MNLTLLIVVILTAIALVGIALGVARTVSMPHCANSAARRRNSSWVSTSSCSGIFAPSGIQYRQRRLQRSVTDRRR